MPKNSIIYLIRHAEKPDNETDRELSVLGRARANALVPMILENEALEHSGKFHHLIAAQTTIHSERPFKTLEPLATHLKVKVNQEYKDKHFERLVVKLKDKKKYKNKTILICWHHGQILHLTNQLGVDKEELPLHWPEDVFGWVLKIKFDENGNKEKFEIINMQMMYTDVGKEPEKILQAQKEAHAAKLKQEANTPTTTATTVTTVTTATAATSASTPEQTPPVTPSSSSPTKTTQKKPSVTKSSPKSTSKTTAVKKAPAKPTPSAKKSPAKPTPSAKKSKTS